MLRIVNGRLFQCEGPIHENARCARIDVRERGTIKSPRAAERKDRRPGWLETGTQSSLMYSGAAPIMDDSCFNRELTLLIGYHSYCKLATKLLEVPCIIMALISSFHTRDGYYYIDV